jgi:hypothetical protein
MQEEEAVWRQVAQLSTAVLALRYSTLDVPGQLVHSIRPPS